MCVCACSVLVTAGSSGSCRETDVVRGPPKQVVHGNTRLRPSSSTVTGAAASNGAGGQSRVYGVVNERGVDANDHVRAAAIVGDSPKVGGYGFVA